MRLDHPHLYMVSWNLNCVPEVYVDVFFQNPNRENGSNNLYILENLSSE